MAVARALGLDLGTRRIGVAVTDALGLTAQPVKTLQRKGGRHDLLMIEQVVREYEVQRVVLGLPVNPQAPLFNPDGSQSEDPRARPEKAARAFADRLQTHLGLPVELIDEGFTTVEAEEVLLQADVSRARRKEVVDKLAASLILQRWLERQSQDAQQEEDADAVG